MVTRRHFTLAARGYLLLAAARHLVSGVMLCWLPTAYFSSELFHPLARVMTLYAWGIIFIVLSFLIILADLIQIEKWAQATLVVSVFLTMLWGLLFFTEFNTDVGNPLSPLMWIILAGKDLVTLFRPMHSPVELIQPEMRRL